MPSVEHEVHLTLLREDPRLAAVLAESLGIPSRPAVPRRSPNAIEPKPGDTGTAWNFDDSAFVAEVQPDSSQAGANADWYGRLAGSDIGNVTANCTQGRVYAVNV